MSAVGGTCDLIVTKAKAVCRKRLILKTTFFVLCLLCFLFMIIDIDFFHSFGCKFRSTETGIVYNNEMADFSSPGQPNPDGIKPSKSNFIVPGKRPQSSISPVIFTDKHGTVRIVAGASGGPLITTATSLVRFFILRGRHSNCSYTVEYFRDRDEEVVVLNCIVFNHSRLVSVFRNT